MKKKLSSYQKLKREIAQLHQDLYDITMKPDSAGSMTLIKWRVTFQAEDAQWSGDTNSNSNKYDGFLGQVK